MNIKEQLCKLKIESKKFYNRCCLWYSNADKENVIKVALPILIVVVGTYACSLSHNEAKKNVDEIFNIADSIRAHYVGKADYWGLSTSSIVKDNILDKKYILNNKIFVNNREIFIGSGLDANIVMPQSQTFDIVIKGLNKAQCIAYSEVELGDNALSLDKISIINNLGFYSFEWGGKNPLPIKDYISKEYCSDNDNSIIWSIK